MTFPASFFELIVILELMQRSKSPKLNTLARTAGYIDMQKKEL